MPTELNLAPRLSQWAVQALTRLVATYAVIQGILIVTGGPKRWSSPGLAVAMSVPGAPASWGISLGIFGLITMCATFTYRQMLVAVGVFMIGVWCFFFCTASLLSVIRTPTTATTGVPTYTVLSIIAMTLAVIYYRSALEVAAIKRPDFVERVRRHVATDEETP